LIRFAKLDTPIQNAVGEGKLTATQAVMLVEFARKHGSINWREWIDLIDRERLTVRQLRMRLRTASDLGSQHENAHNATMR
jgi:hypothetical protein